MTRGSPLTQGTDTEEERKAELCGKGNLKFWRWSPTKFKKSSMLSKQLRDLIGN